MSSRDVSFWSILDRKRGKKPYLVRWVVAGEMKQEGFTTKALADSFRSGLVQAANEGRAFDETTGRPENPAAAHESPTWFSHARKYAIHKWEDSAPTSRRSTADALVAATVAMLPQDAFEPAGLRSEAAVRRALFRWAFNGGATEDAWPGEVRETLAWVDQVSRPVSDLTESGVTRAVLRACGLKVNGAPAAATTARRKRAVLHNALGFAIEEKLLIANPVKQVQFKAAEVAETVDRRVVANPNQVAALLEAVRTKGKRGKELVAYDGCCYYGSTRPSEAVALREPDCDLPKRGWGSLMLSNNEPRAGMDWTDSGVAREARELKHRGKNETRPVPIPPVLVAMLRHHIDTYGVGEDGRLFRSGRGLILQATETRLVWRQARRDALTPAQVASPLAGRVYDLRHAWISFCLNSGVPATEVASRAGHGVAVMLKVYANCLDGEAAAVNARIDTALMSKRPASSPPTADEPSRE